MSRSRIAKFNRISELINSWDNDRPSLPVTQNKDQEGIIDTRPRIWTNPQAGDFYPSISPRDTLPVGEYVVLNNPNNGEPYFSARESCTDELFPFEDSTSNKIIAEIEKFWSMKAVYEEYGFIWKRGVLLWGPQGSGKTSTVQMIANFVMSKGGIVVYAGFPPLTAQGLMVLRQVEPTRPVVLIVEDIDSIIDNHGESEVLSLLDGELQVDNIITLATTNYPENLDKRIKNRPSRFDMVEKIGLPPASARKAYFVFKNPRFKNGCNEAELKIWVNKTEGFSFAHMKEVIIGVEILEKSLEEVIDKLKKMGSDMPDSKNSDKGEESRGFGFAAG